MVSVFRSKFLNFYNSQKKCCVLQSFAINLLSWWFQSSFCRCLYQQANGNQPFWCGHTLAWSNLQVKPLGQWRCFPVGRSASRRASPRWRVARGGANGSPKTGQKHGAVDAIAGVPAGVVFGWMGLLPSRELTYPPDKAYLKMIFLFPRWDMLISRRVIRIELFG